MTAVTRVAFLFTTTLLLFAGCGKTEPKPEPIRPVRAIKVGDLKAIEGRAFPGRAKAKVEVDLSFQVSGPLVSLPVDVGTNVKLGEVIATIDPRDLQTILDTTQGNLDRARANLLAMEHGARPEEIEQLKASLAEAEATYHQAAAEHNRNARLVKSGTVTKSQYDISLARAKRSAAQVKKAKEDLNIGLEGARPEDLDAKRAEIRALEAAVANAKNQLNYTVLAAPFAGEVAARYVDNFQTVQAKQPIVRLLDVSKIEVTVQVPENLIALVPSVKEVVCRFDAFGDREFAGQITKIGSEASQTTRTYPVTVQVDQPQDVRILPGMAATVRSISGNLNSGKDQDLIVPPSAVFNTDGSQQTYIWVVENGGDQVATRAVKTGRLTPVGLTVTDGLQRGEWVVTSGINSLRENQQVRILSEGTQ